jgi:hypothetical protein
MSPSKVYFGGFFMVKKQLLWGGIALLVVLFALGITGCDSSGTTDDTEKSSNTQLSTIQIGSGLVAYFYSDMPKEKLADISIYAPVSLSNREKDNAPVTLTAGTNFKGKMEIAKVAKGGGASASFVAYVEGTTKFTFAHEDEVYIKMIAEDGKTIIYYGAKVEIGTDAGLNSATVGGQAVRNFGTPSGTLAGVAVNTAGFILMSVVETEAGFEVEIIANDPDATVTFGKGTKGYVFGQPSWTFDDEATWSGTKRAINFIKDDQLGVKVVSQNGLATNYYKIKIELMIGMDIPYGTPVVGTGDFVDPLWNALEWIDVEKQNLAETDDSFFENPTTTGRAKLYWDVDGLYLYVDVTTEYISINSGYAHSGSSIELFINEAHPTITTGGFGPLGGQYRLDTNGAITGTAGAIQMMQALDRYKIWKTPGGYAVMFQAPWRFGAQYPLRDNKSIGLEVQINCADESMTGRTGVLKWYNTVDNTYENASACAPGILKLNGASLPAQNPGITTQPANQRVPLNGAITALTVVAASPDEGTLSYQWYSSATSANTGGTIIASATSASYTPTVSTATAGEHFFYVEVKNTRGTTNKTLNSNAARILVFDPAVTPDDIQLVKPDNPKWDAAANALVVDNGAGVPFGGNNSFATIIELAIPSGTNLETYVRLEFDLDTYENGVIVPVPTTWYSNNISYTIFDGGGTQIEQQYNGPNGNPGYSWPLADAVKAADYSGGGIVRVTAGNKTNAVDKVVIRSVKLVVGD